MQDGTHQLGAGTSSRKIRHRRTEASRRAGLKTIAAIVEDALLAAFIFVAKLRVKPPSTGHPPIPPPLTLNL